MTEIYNTQKWEENETYQLRIFKVMKMSLTVNRRDGVWRTKRNRRPFSGGSDGTTQLKSSAATISIIFSTHSGSKLFNADLTQSNKCFTIINPFLLGQPLIWFVRTELQKSDRRLWTNRIRKRPGECNRPPSERRNIQQIAPGLSHGDSA